MSRRPRNPAMTVRIHSQDVIAFENQTAKMILADWVPLAVLPQLGGGYKIVYCKRWVMEAPPVPFCVDGEKKAPSKRSKKNK